MERIAIIQEDIRQIETEINHLQNVRQEKLAEMEEMIRQIRNEEAPRYTSEGTYRPASTWRSSSVPAGQRRSGSATAGGFDYSAPPANAGVRSPEQAAGTIKIVLRNDKGDRVHGQLRPDVRLQSVMDLYCGKRSLPRGSVDFFLHGRRLDPQMTADQMGAEPGATIDVVPRYNRPPSTGRY